jgi:hypothetical protein
VRVAGAPLVVAGHSAEVVPVVWVELAPVLEFPVFVQALPAGLRPWVVLERALVDLVVVAAARVSADVLAPSAVQVELALGLGRWLVLVQAWPAGWCRRVPERALVDRAVQVLVPGRVRPALPVPGLEAAGAPAE